ncbi:hypothetical protein HAX54_006090, partial [Datura stramonium]|nr:hypothetical protein [Datura stramonium]
MAGVNKLVKLLPLYLMISGFYHDRKATDWSRDETYMNNENFEPLEVQFVDTLPQQVH